MNILIVYPVYKSTHIQSYSIPTTHAHSVCASAPAAIPFQSTSPYRIGASTLDLDWSDDPFDWSDEDTEEYKPIIPGENDQHIGQATPIGNAFVPLFLLSLIYIALLRIFGKCAVR